MKPVRAIQGAVILASWARRHIPAGFLPRQRFVQIFIIPMTNETMNKTSTRDSVLATTSRHFNKALKVGGIVYVWASFSSASLQTTSLPHPRQLPSSIDVFGYQQLMCLSSKVTSKKFARYEAGKFYLHEGIGDVHIIQGSGL